MRFQVFRSREVDAHPVFSAPWHWLAFSLANLLSMNWMYCRLVDSRTGETLMEWVKADRPIVLGGDTSAAIAHVKIGADGRKHTHLIGSVRYAAGQEPEGGHKPLTIIEVEQKTRSKSQPGTNGQ